MLPSPTTGNEKPNCVYILASVYVIDWVAETTPKPGKPQSFFLDPTAANQTTGFGFLPLIVLSSSFSSLSFLV